MQYLLVLPVTFYRASPGVAATESAFAEHLTMLRDQLAPEVTELCIAAPVGSDAEYQANRQHLGHLDEAKERISFLPLHPAGVGRLEFWLWHAKETFTQIRRAARRAEVIHAGMSPNVLVPFEFAAILFGARAGNKTVFIVDIDERRDATMRRATGHLSLKSYFLDQYVYAPLRSAQMRFAARSCSLVLLKGQGLVDDYGSRAPQVKYFLDSAYSKDAIIPADRLQNKLDALAQPDTPLRLVYFGRLVPRKGVDCCLRALAKARDLGAAPFEFHVVGGGEQEPELRRLCSELELDEVTTFHGPKPFDRAFFDLLYTFHVLLAAPLTEDTPRSALDAMACGMSIVAFDTYYYRELSGSEAVDVVPWRDESAMAEKIVELSQRRDQLAKRIGAAVKFAANNSQEQWLNVRTQWMHEFVFNREPGSTIGSPST